MGASGMTSGRAANVCMPIIGRVRRRSADLTTELSRDGAPHLRLGRVDSFDPRSTGRAASPREPPCRTKRTLTLGLSASPLSSESSSVSRNHESSPTEPPATNGTAHPAPAEARVRARQTLRSRARRPTVTTASPPMVTAASLSDRTVHGLSRHSGQTASRSARCVPTTRTTGELPTGRHGPSLTDRSACMRASSVLPSVRAASPPWARCRRPGRAPA